MRKISVKSGDLFSVLCVCGLWIHYHNSLIMKIDELFFMIFGKNLLGRNLPLRILVIGGIFTICLLLPILFNHLLCDGEKPRPAAYAVVLLILAVPAAQLLILCANQVLRRDDYWEIADARQYGFPGSMFYEIQRYNGRYTRWGLKSLHAVFPDVPFIDITLALNFVILIIGAVIIARQLLKCRENAASGKTETRLFSIVIGFGLSLAFILLASNIWEVWFWGSGTMVYGLGISLCVLTVGLALRAADDPAQGKAGMILPALTCFLTCGCSELCTASLAAFFFVALIWNRIRTKRWNRRLLFFFLEVCLCTTGIFLMSGSMGLAQEHAHVDPQGEQSILAGFIDRLPGIISWAFSGLIGFTFIKYHELLAFLGLAFLIGTEFRLTSDTRKRFLILAALLTVIAYCVLLINTALDYMPPRVITIGICWFFTGMALVCIMLGSLVNGVKRLRFGPVKMLFCALFLCLMMNDFYSENIDEARTIRGSWFIRNMVLQQAAGSVDPVRTCSLPCPGSSRDDILPDPEDEFNKAVALFYQVSAISADVGCPPYGESFIVSDK